MVVAVVDSTDDEWPAAEEFRFTSEPAQKPEAFTEAESKVMELVAKGLSNVEIGKRLKIQDRSVDRRLHDIYRKMGLSYKEGGKSIRVVAVLRWLGLDKPPIWQVFCETCDWRTDDLEMRRDAVALGHQHIREKHYSDDEYAFRVRGLRRQDA